MVQTVGTDNINKVPFHKGPWMVVFFIAGTVGLAFWMIAFTNYDLPR